MALNTQRLVLNTKKELVNLIHDELLDQVAYGDENEQYQALEDIEQIIYVLRNCAYEGKENE